MSYKIIVSDNFAREFKRLLKKHPQLKNTLHDLLPSLSNNPTQGVSLGKGCYKIRLSSPDKSGRKSGGFRLIAYVVYKEDRLFLLSIYDKSQTASITPAEISEIIKYVERTGG